MEKMVTEAKPVSPAAPLDAPLEGGKALTKSLLGLKRERIWAWGVHLQDDHP